MIIPTIHFNGNCDEAIKLYKQVLNVQVDKINYAKDAPEGYGLEQLPPNNVMHSEIIIAGSKFSLTDGAEKPLSSDNFSLLIFFDTKEELTEAFNKLSAGGKVIEPIGSQFWASLYCMFEDKFGLGWQFMIKADA